MGMEKIKGHEVTAAQLKQMVSSDKLSDRMEYMNLFGLSLGAMMTAKEYVDAATAKKGAGGTKKADIKTGDGAVPFKNGTFSTCFVYNDDERYKNLQDAIPRVIKYNKRYFIWIELGVMVRNM